MSMARFQVTCPAVERGRRPVEMDAVVDHGGQEVVGRGDGVDVAGEMEVDVVAGMTRALPPPVAPPFIPKTGPSDGSRRATIGPAARQAQGVDQADGRRRLALAGRGGRHGRDHDQPAGPGRLGSDRGRGRSWPCTGRMAPESRGTGRAWPRFPGSARRRAGIFSAMGESLLLATSLTGKGGMLQPLSHILPIGSARRPAARTPDQAVVGEAEIAIVADDQMVEDLELHDPGGEAPAPG